MPMTIKDLITCALEYEPLTETVAQRILLRILEILRRGLQRELPEPKDNTS